MAESNSAKAKITNAQSGSAEYTEAIKVFLRCDGAIEILNWAMDLGASDFSISPTMTQSQKRLADT